MSTAQALLPLPVAGPARCRAAFTGPGTAEPSTARPIRRQAGRSVLRPADGPHGWSLDPYRRTRTGVTRAISTWAALGRESAPPLIALDGASEALLATLRAGAPSARGEHDLAGQTIALGAGVDPYPEVERRLGVTRSLLETLTASEGLTLHLTTRSPLVLRDLDLLAELDRSHSITVDVPVPTLDEALARVLEPPIAGSGAPAPGAPAVSPNRRLETLAAIAAQGMTTRLLCLPIAPGINDSQDHLEPLVAAARDAGAVDVAAHCLELRGRFRGPFFEWLGEEHPALVTRYRQLYGRRGSLRQADKNRVLKEFRSLRLAYGFPRGRPGRG